MGTQPELPPNESFRRKYMKEEERDFSVFKPREPFTVDDETKKKLPLWKTLYCGKCGKWDTLQAEISTDQDAIRLTCIGCEDQITLPLQFPESLTPGPQNKATKVKAGYGSCDPCRVHFDTKAEADRHYRTEHGKTGNEARIPWR